MQGLIGRWLVAVVVVLIVAAAIEQTYRVYLFGWAAFSYARVNSVHDLWLSGMIRASEDRDIAFELKPGVDSYFKLASFRTNSTGLRYGEIMPAKPPSTRRIALVGSSFSMPAGVTLEDSWHHVVERDLDVREPGRRHEIVNFAVGGYNARQLLAVLKSKVYAYQPELILFEATTHTPYIEYPEEFFRRRYVESPVTRPFWGSFVVERIRSRFNPVAADPTAYPPDKLAAADAMMREAREIAAAHGTPICFVILNMAIPYQSDADALEQLASKYSACVVNTTDAFRGADLRELVIYPTDQHPNAKAHRIFAGVIAPRVARELGVPLP